MRSISKSQKRGSLSAAVVPSPTALTLPHLDVCFGLVEQSQCGVPAAVWSQRDEWLQPLQTQAEMCSPVGGDIIQVISLQGPDTTSTLHSPHWTWAAKKKGFEKLLFYNVINRVSNVGINVGRDLKVAEVIYYSAIQRLLCSLSEHNNWLKDSQYACI